MSLDSSMKTKFSAKDLKLPAMPMDFPILLNPYVDSDWVEQSIDLVERSGLIVRQGGKIRNAPGVGMPGPDGRTGSGLNNNPEGAEFDFRAIGIFGFHALPTASREAVQALADFVIWLYFWDDGFMDTAEPNISELNFEISAICRVLDGGTPKTPISTMIHDIRLRFGELGGYEALYRFTEDVRGYVFGCLAEIVSRTTGRFPHNIDEYEPLRIVNSAVLPTLDFCEISSGAGYIPSSFFASPEIIALRLTIAKVVSYSNDVWSVLREIDNCPLEFGWNLALVYAQDAGGDMQINIDRAAEIVNREIGVLYEIYSKLRTNPDESVRLHIDALRNSVRGMHTWQGTNYRYLRYWNGCDRRAFD